MTGRGIGTFVPKLYDYLDNQYLLTLIEGGLVAVIALVSLLLGALWLARSAGRRATDPSTAMLARALGASVAVHIVTFAAYDGLTFPTAATSLFLVIGLLGALWRLTPPPVGAS